MIETPIAKGTRDGVTDIYVVATCRSVTTLSIARSLYHIHGIEAWVPRQVNLKPKRKEKSIVASFPGFVFIPQHRLKDAELCKKRLQVPSFSALVMNSQIKTCSHEELMIFEKTIKELNEAPFVAVISIRVGDTVTVTKGPLSGLVGEVTEVFVSKTLKVKIKTKSDFCPVIELPAAYIG